MRAGPGRELGRDKATVRLFDKAFLSPLFPNPLCTPNPKPPSVPPPSTHPYLPLFRPPPNLIVCPLFWAFSGVPHRMVCVWEQWPEIKTERGLGAAENASFVSAAIHTVLRNGEEGAWRVSDCKSAVPKWSNPATSSFFSFIRSSSLLPSPLHTFNLTFLFFFFLAPSSFHTLVPIHVFSSSRN